MAKCSRCPVPFLPVCIHEIDESFGPDTKTTKQIIDRSKFESQSRHGWPCAVRPLFPDLPPRKADGSGPPRVGVGGLALVHPHVIHRGIGRYVRGLVGALAEAAPHVEFLIYYPATYPAPVRFRQPNIYPVSIPATVEDRLRGNPDGLDVYLEPAPPLGCPAAPDVPRRVAVVYDAIPDHEAQTYLADPEHRARHVKSVETAGTYDALLALSAWAANDIVERYKYDPDKVHVIGAGVDEVFRRGWPAFGDVGAIGVNDGHFVLHVGGTDARKGGRELLQAFAMLPEPIRLETQLVYAYAADGVHTRNLRDLAAQLGIGDRFLMTGFVPDENLSRLYQLCAVFCFPSRSEGFGLPAAEAMACGAPVILRDATSLPEVGGDAALYHDDDPAELAELLEMVLSNDGLARSMRQASSERAEAWTWEGVAARALPHVPGGPEEQKRGGSRRVFPQAAARGRPLTTESDGTLPRADEAVNGESAQPRRSGRPRVAIVSPFPPVLSGVADYAERLAVALEPHVDVSRNFNRVAWDQADALIYHIGNHKMHGWVYDCAMKRPGVVVIHDIELPNLGRPDALESLCQRSKAIVVHSENAYARLPAGRAPAHIIPFGAEPNVLTAEKRAEVRAPYGLEGHFIVTVAGIVAVNKMILEVMAGFAYACQTGQLPPIISKIVILGDPLTGTFVEQFKRSLTDNMWNQILEIPDARGNDFADFCAASDIGVTLRQPPTNGETSAACLDFLRAGVPCLVSNVGSFAEYPDDAVCKIYPDGPAEPSSDGQPPRPVGIEGIARVLGRLARDPDYRAAVGAAGLAHVQAHNAWDCVVRAYLGLIGAKPRVPLGTPQRAAQAMGEAAQATGAGKR
jgi:glycosyltransferase involved in cell wall biosynthesis